MPGGTLDPDASSTRAGAHQRRAIRARRWTWLVTILASVLLVTHILAGFARLAYVWTTGRLALGPRGVTIYLYEKPHGDPSGFFTEWQNTPEWFHAAWWRSDADLFAFGSSLLPLGVFLALVALARWYRVWRPFHRRGRRNRAYQFGLVRWLWTLAALATLTAGVLSQWKLVEWTTPYHRVAIGAGRLAWSNEGRDTLSWIGKATLEDLPYATAVTGPALQGKGTSPTYFVLYEWLRLGSKATAEASLWLLFGVSLACAGFLWFMRLRFYPMDGRCTNPGCGYDMAGIEDVTKCPECGREIVLPMG